MNPWESLVQRLAPVQNVNGGKVDARFITEGLVKRGLPLHVAEGFALNAGDESGFDPGINEINPVVPGSRGGFGLFQWTGDRRVRLENLAAQRGVPASDPELQLDVVALELQGPERRAAESILNTSSTSEAAAAVVTDFLRPAPENRDRRVAKFLGAPQSSAPAQKFDFTSTFNDLFAQRQSANGGQP